MAVRSDELLEESGDALQPPAWMHEVLQDFSKELETLGEGKSSWLPVPVFISKEVVDELPDSAERYQTTLTHVLVQAAGWTTEMLKHDAQVLEGCGCVLVVEGQPWWKIFLAGLLNDSGGNGRIFPLVSLMAKTRLTL